MVLEGPPTAYDRENDLYELAIDGRILEAIKLGRVLRAWWLDEKQWPIDWPSAAMRVSWINGFTHALNAIDQSESRRLSQELGARLARLDSNETSGGSGKSNQP